ncbi:MAG: hypothetical protein ACI4RD_00515 [Kiritimatiellia bacterium]
MKAFAAKIDSFDLVMVVPLFNYAGAKNILKDGDTDGTAIRGWVEKGGVMVVSEANYLNARGWVEKIAPEVKGLTTSKCTSSQWAVLGYVTNERPPHALRMFPNVITEGDSWPHFDEPPVGNAARVLARCSEGNPVSLLYGIGRGAVILTTLRQPATASLENYLAFACLKRTGLKLGAFSMSPIAVGEGRLTMMLEEKPQENVSLELVVAAVDGEPKTFKSGFKGTSAALDYRISVRGAVTVTLNVVTKGGKRPLFVRKTSLPDLMTLHSANYRGIVSTARRLSSVPFRMEFAPDREDLHGAEVEVALFDVAGSVVTNGTTTLCVTGEVKEATVKLELPAKMSAGGYGVKATLRKGGLVFAATNSLEVLAPRLAQCVIDLDNTFLVNGRPYFPLGIYHAVGDYEGPARIGFNTVQFWKWEVRPDRFGMATGLHKAGSKGLRCMFESNHWGDGIWKYCAEKYADHPSLLMWEVDDEPSETDTAKNLICNAGWHKYDRQHPTSLTSCRPDLFGIQCRAGDVFAFDPYGSRDTPFDAVGKTVEWCRLAQAATKGRQPLMLVPHAFPSDPGVLRPVAYAGLVHDVRAIFWYCWKQTSGGTVGVGLHAHPEHQTEISNLICEVNAMLPGLFSPVRRSFEAGPVHGLVTGRKGKWAEHLIILVNTTGEAVEADFTVPEAHFRPALKRVFMPLVPAFGKDGKRKRDRKGNPVFEEPWEKLEGPGHFKRVFKPWETAVYRW